MNTPPSPVRSARLRDHDTGFPEPFGDHYNTTLPYPGADLSPNATISSDNLTASQSMKRRRLSMLTKHRRTVSQNSTISQSMHGVLPLIVSSVPGRAPSPSPSSAVDGTMSVEGEGSLREDHETPPTSPEVDRESETNGGVWGRLRRSVKG